MDIDKLEALALAAGVDHPWHWHSDPITDDPLGRSRYEVTTLGRTITRTYYSDPTALHEAAFIAAFNPAVALELIAGIKRLRRVNDDYLHIIHEHQERLAKHERVIPSDPTAVSGAAPDGWQVAPKELRQEMDDAMYHAMDLGSNQHLWDAALAVAPLPPALSADQGKDQE